MLHWEVTDSFRLQRLRSIWTCDWEAFSWLGVALFPRYSVTNQTDKLSRDSKPWNCVRSLFTGNKPNKCQCKKNNQKQNEPIRTECLVRSLKRRTPLVSSAAPDFCPWWRKSPVQHLTRSGARSHCLQSRDTFINVNPGLPSDGNPW